MINDTIIFFYTESAENYAFLYQIKDDKMLSFALSLYGLIFLLGIIGNILTIIIFTRNAKYLSSGHSGFFIRFLAWLDLFSCLFAAPLAVHRDVQNRFFPIRNQLICSITSFIQVIFPTLSVNTLLAISLERYFAVTKPFLKITIIKRNVCTVLYCSITAINCATMSSITTTFGGKYVCYNYEEKTTLMKTVILYVTAFVLAAVMISSLTLYIRMFQFLRKRKKVLASHTNSISSKGEINVDLKGKNERRMIKQMFTCFYVFIVYLVVIIPALLSYIGALNLRKSITIHISFLNNVINFFVYFTSMKTFRDSLKHFFHDFLKNFNFKRNF